MAYEKSYRTTMKDNYKQNIVIFDLDGTIMNSDNYIVTNKQAYELTCNTENKLPKPSKLEEDKFCIEYLRRNHDNIEPYYGILDLFVSLAKLNQVAIVTSRFEILKAQTIMWLERQIITLYGNDTWRKIYFKTYFNEHKLKSLEYKKGVFKDIQKTYNISLIIDDHPDIKTWANKNGINILVPGTGYKNLNGVDLTQVKVVEKETTNVRSRVSRAK